jgi:peptidoglycan biosynthesis protein MviN/MurJ (putative lipid II flippase)
MKNLILAAFAALSLSAAVVPVYAASTVSGDAAATRMQQTGGETGGN